MSPASLAYGVALVALGGWATFTTSRTLRSRGGWRRHPRLIVVGAAFVASCLVPGVALLAEGFRPWMIVPLGVCYVALVPLPCYFRWANRGRMRSARTILFLLVGGGLIAAGTGWVPLSWFGL